MGVFFHFNMASFSPHSNWGYINKTDLIWSEQSLMNIFVWLIAQLLMVPSICRTILSTYTFYLHILNSRGSTSVSYSVLGLGVFFDNNPDIKKLILILSWYYKYDNTVWIIQLHLPCLKLNMYAKHIFQPCVITVTPHKSSALNDDITKQ